MTEEFVHGKLCKERCHVYKNRMNLDKDLDKLCVNCIFRRMVYE